MESNLINHSDHNHNSNNNEIWKPDVFILGPGGAKGFLELGLMLIKRKQD